MAGRRGPRAVLPNGNLLLGTGNGTFDSFTDDDAPSACDPGRRRLRPRFQRARPGSAAIPLLHSPYRAPASARPACSSTATPPPTSRAALTIYQPRWPAPALTSHGGGGESPTARTPSRRPSRTAAPRSPRRSPTRPPASFSAHDFANVNLPATVGGSDTRFRRLRRWHPTAGSRPLRSRDWTYSSGGQTLIEQLGQLRQQRRRDGHRGHEVQQHRGRRDDREDGQQTGNLFANSPVNIANFTTTFDFQIHPPSEPDHAGWRQPENFIIQNDPSHGRPGLRRVVTSSSSRPHRRLTVVDNFTPFDVKAQDIVDADTASTAETLLPTFPGTAAPERGAVAADKSGRIYLLNTDNLGGFNAGGPDQVLQEFTANPNGLIYSSRRSTSTAPVSWPEAGRRDQGLRPGARSGDEH